MLVRELPPLTRGILPISLPVSSRVGITPAHAGNTLAMGTPGTNRRNYPRSRGEYSCGMLRRDPRRELPPLTRGILGVTVSAGVTWELPPLTRGILSGKRGFALDNGITPAHAGNTLTVPVSKPRARNYPRSRGEYSRYQMPTPHQRELPPLTRGIRNRI